MVTGCGAFRSCVAVHVTLYNTNTESSAGPRAHYCEVTFVMYEGPPRRCQAPGRQHALFVRLSCIRSLAVFPLFPLINVPAIAECGGEQHPRMRAADPCSN